jgi:DNA-binding transcriptional regulator GbsR (MarR family)
MSKKTAVEWLMEQITYKTDDGERRNTFTDTVDLSEYFNQAMEMDKEQKIDAFDTGRRKGDWIFDGEKYYEETFKNS